MSRGIALTGSWLTGSDEFKQWVDSPDAKLWLFCVPRAGKIVLAPSTAQEVCGEVMGSQRLLSSIVTTGTSPFRTLESYRLIGKADRLAARGKF